MQADRRRKQLVMPANISDGRCVLWLCCSTNCHLTLTFCHWVTDAVVRVPSLLLSRFHQQHSHPNLFSPHPPPWYEGPHSLTEIHLSCCNLSFFFCFLLYFLMRMSATYEAQVHLLAFLLQQNKLVLLLFFSLSNCWLGVLGL